MTKKRIALAVAGTVAGTAAVAATVGTLYAIFRKRKSLKDMMTPRLRKFTPAQRKVFLKESHSRNLPGKTAYDVVQKADEAVQRAQSSRKMQSQYRKRTLKRYGRKGSTSRFNFGKVATVVLGVLVAFAIAGGTAHAFMSKSAAPSSRGASPISSVKRQQGSTNSATKKTYGRPAKPSSAASAAPLTPASKNCSKCDNTDCDGIKNPSLCPHFKHTRENHPDSQLGKFAPYIHNTINFRRDGSDVIINNRRYALGTATANSSNCLLDTLQQQLNIKADLDTVRKDLQQRFKDGRFRVTKNNFLTFEAHWGAAVDLLFQHDTTGEKKLTQKDVRLVCVDLEHSGYGDVVGNGSKTIYLAREHQNHFVPLKFIGNVR